MLTTFSMAAARNFPLTLQATCARLGSPGEPRLLELSSAEPSLKTHPHRAIVTLLLHTPLHYRTRIKAAWICSSTRQSRKNSRPVKDARLLQSVLVLVHVPDSNSSIIPAGRQKPFLVTPSAGDRLREPRKQWKQHSDKTQWEVVYMWTFEILVSGTRISLFHFGKQGFKPFVCRDDFK